jgi:sugar lactone lactonase YvrE
MDNLEILATGLAFGESPRWHAGRLWLANWGAQEVLALTSDGAREVMAHVPTFNFSIDWSAEGQLLVTSATLVLRQQRDGTLKPFVDVREIAPNGLNEIVVDGHDNIYVNGPGFNLMTGEEPKPGEVILVTPDGAMRQVADGVAFPNGMAVTPDNSTLVVAESHARRLTAFDIAHDGSLSNRRIWADLGDGVPDGICLDVEGAIWYADVPNKRCVRVREGGEVLQSVQADRGCFACMLGGADGRTLFIVAKEWLGASNMANAPRDGQVVTTTAPSTHAGRP